MAFNPAAFFAAKAKAKARARAKHEDETRKLAHIERLYGFSVSFNGTRNVWCIELWPVDFRYVGNSDKRRRVYVPSTLDTVFIKDYIKPAFLDMLRGINGLTTSERADQVLRFDHDMRGAIRWNKLA